MSVFKIWKGKRINPKHKDWNKATWYIYKRLNGRVIHKAIKEARTKEEAEIAERELIRKAFNKRYGERDSTTFGDFTNNQYSRYVEQNNVNIPAKRLYNRLLCSHFERRALCDISPQDLRNVQAEFRKRYSASSVNLIMSTASKIFTLACQEGILDKNPMQYVTRLKEPPPRDRLLTEDEKERLWKELEADILILRLVTLAINLPLRRGQILAMSPDAIDLQNGLLHIVSSKGRSARMVPMNTSAANTLRNMLDDGQIPFPLRETGIRKRWMKLLKKAKIENFRFHDLRKEFASTLRRGGIHSKTIQDLFGHSSSRITDVYLPPEFEAMREAVNSLDEKVQEAGGVQ